MCIRDRVSPVRNLAGLRPHREDGRAGQDTAAYRPKGTGRRLRYFLSAHTTLLYLFNCTNKPIQNINPSNAFIIRFRIFIKRQYDFGIVIRYFLKHPQKEEDGDLYHGLTRKLTFDRMIPPYGLEVTYDLSLIHI